ncbi:MAG: glycosyltransferase family 2 protein [bacterium]|nr:glycosyltransferase family 2 protein [bacterium]
MPIIATKSENFSENPDEKKEIISCIIPFYNEEKRISSVLKAISQIKGISEIICIDDGSTDNTSALVENTFSKIRLIKLGKNKGKSAAIENGLTFVKTRYVFLIDSDLNNLNIEKIEKAINAVKTEDSIDMFIFKIITTPTWLLFLVKFFRGDVIASGHRILKTADLRQVFSSRKPKNYQLEVAINEYMMENKKKCFWLEGIGTNPHKSEKTNLKGWIDDLTVILLLFGYLGVFNWLKQYFLFCKKGYEKQI